MNKLKDAIEELKIIKGYVNAYSGCDKIKIKLDADGDISACDGRVIFFFRTEDKTPYDIANEIIEEFRIVKERRGE